MDRHLKQNQRRSTPVSRPPASCRRTFRNRGAGSTNHRSVARGTGHSHPRGASRQTPAPAPFARTRVSPWAGFPSHHAHGYLSPPRVRPTPACHQEGQPAGGTPQTLVAQDPGPGAVVLPILRGLVPCQVRTRVGNAGTVSNADAWDRRKALEADDVDANRSIPGAGPLGPTGVGHAGSTGGDADGRLA